MDNQKIMHQNTTQNQGELKREMKRCPLLMVDFGDAIGEGIFVCSRGIVS
ncbi:hypothetical protein [Helicobacter pylori]